jgi:hypothetical protein
VLNPSGKLNYRASAAYFHQIHPACTKNDDYGEYIQSVSLTELIFTEKPIKCFVYSKTWLIDADWIDLLNRCLSIYGVLRHMTSDLISNQQQPP